MKLIDKNGMIFNRINIIDLIIILFLVSFAVIFYFGYRIVNDRQAGRLSWSEQTKWVRVRVDFSNVIPEVAEIMTEGDVEQDEFGAIRGKIDKISKMPAEEVVLVDDGSFVTVKHPVKKTITAEFVLLCSRQGGRLYYNGYMIKMGNTLGFSTDLYSINGIVTRFAVDKAKDV